MSSVSFERKNKNKTKRLQYLQCQFEIIHLCLVNVMNVKQLHIKTLFLSHMNQSFVAKR